MGLLVVIAALGFGWNYAWRYAAQRLDTETTRLIAQSNDAGREIECDKRRVEGYPFRVGIFCDRLALYAERNGLSVKSGAFRSAAQFYRPGQIIAELDGPLAANLPGAGNYAADWNSMRASVNVSLSGLRRISIAANKLNLTGNDTAIQPASSSSLKADAESIELHLRPAEEEGHDDSVDLAFLADNLKVESADLLPLPAIGIGADLRLDGMKSQLRPGFDIWRHLRANGVAGQIRHVQFMPVEGGNVTISGPFDIGQDGIVNATLDIAVADARSITALLKTMFPGQNDMWDQLHQGFAVLAASKGGDSNSRSVKVTIDRGQIFLGFFPVGEIPPLF